MERIVVCMKWGTLYGPDYVNVLLNAVSAHLEGSFRFVCFTDDSTGVDDRVDCVSIPPMTMAAGGWARGGWPKLSIFSDEAAAKLGGRCLFIDLDTIVTGPLDPLFTRPGNPIMIREWPRLADRLRRRRHFGASGIFAWDGGSLQHIWDEFEADSDTIREQFRQEQQFLEHRAEDLTFWPEDWVISFKRTLMAPPLLDRIIGPKPVPPEARILAFHGDPRPIDVVPDKGQRWGKGWHYGRGAVPYVRDYWLRYGGSDPELDTRE